MAERNENRVLMVVLVAAVSGCSSFDSVLPDREKEYKYSTEIPSLEIPPELSSSSIEDATTRSRGGSVSARGRDYAQTAPRRVEPEPEGKASPVEQSGNGAYIRLDEPYGSAWRMLGRALSRLEIEIDDLNRTDGLYYVIYEDSNSSNSDDSLFSSLAFWSDDNAIVENDFRIKLTDHGEHSEIRVLDDSDEVQSSGNGLKLLESLRDQLNELGEL